MPQLLGTAYIKVDGDLLRSNPGAKIDLGGQVREPVVGAGTVHGYAEKTKEATVECEISLAKGDSLETIRSITNATITFECDTGQVYIVRHAFLTDPPVLSEGEGGKIPLKFAGMPAEEA
ncbi:MAG: phage tail protein [Gammaproteobacteria bacterium]|nr:MAG: phage tail protein [Gammaproteobacteria bacterium]